MQDLNAVELRQDAEQSGVIISLDGDHLKLVSKRGALTPDLKNKLVKAKPELIVILHVEDVLQTVIDGLPTTVEEVISSPIFDPWNEHTELIANGEFDHQFLRQYIASWLLVEKRFPYLIRMDATKRLGIGHAN